VAQGPWLDRLWRDVTRAIGRQGGAYLRFRGEIITGGGPGEVAPSVAFATLPLVPGARQMLPREAAAHLGALLQSIVKPFTGARGRSLLAPCKVWKRPPRPDSHWERLRDLHTNNPGPIVKFLRQHGIDPNLEPGEGNPWEWCISWCYPMSWSAEQIE